MVSKKQLFERVFGEAMSDEEFNDLSKDMEIAERDDGHVVLILSDGTEQILRNTPEEDQKYLQELSAEDRLRHEQAVARLQNLALDLSIGKPRGNA